MIFRLQAVSYFSFKLTARETQAHSSLDKRVKKSEREHVRHFLHKTCNYIVGSFWKFHLVVVKNNGKEMLVEGLNGVNR